MKYDTIHLGGNPYALLTRGVHQAFDALNQSSTNSTTIDIQPFLANALHRGYVLAVTDDNTTFLCSESIRTLI
jgi:hypothetical protein